MLAWVDVLIRNNVGLDARFPRPNEGNIERCRDALREASRPLSSVEIADILMAAKNISKDDPQIRRYIADSVLPVMRRLVKRGIAAKTGSGPTTRWEIAR